jgi:hypothetical protein
MIDMDRVSWLSRSAIEQTAARVLTRARRRLDRDLCPPVPIEQIIEQVFGLRLYVEDLRERYPDLPGVDDLLGATLIGRKQVLVHKGLLDEPESQGRYFFTCAHELAHWVLHRNLARPDPESGEGPGDPSGGILCRLAHSRKRGEWQADQLAAALLMPEAETRQAYRESVSDRPLVVLNRESSFCKQGKPLWLEPVLSHGPYHAQRVIEAGGFSNVSRAAMWVRLQELGLVINAVDKPWLTTA